MADDDELNKPATDDDRDTVVDPPWPAGSRTPETTPVLPPLAEVNPPEPDQPQGNATTFGPHGLHSGCRAILFLFVYFAFLVALLIPYSIYDPSALKQGAQPEWRAELRIQVQTLDFSATLFATLLFAWLERRRLGDYGLPLRAAFGRQFWIGGLTGFAEVALFIGILASTGYCSLGPLQLHGTAVLRFASLWGIAFLLVGLGEELLMRGYILTALTRVIGFWPSALATSLLFALIHIKNPGETRFGLFDVFVFGMIASLMLRRTGSLWLSIGYHVFWDWGQSFFFGVPDSGLVIAGSLLRTKTTGPVLLTGGSTGPEGSVLVFLMLMVTGGVVIAVCKPAVPERNEGKGHSLPAA
jgi:uncharacterized protein